MSGQRCIPLEGGRDGVLERLEATDRFEQWRPNA